MLIIAANRNTRTVKAAEVKVNEPALAKEISDFKNKFLNLPYPESNLFFGTKLTDLQVTTGDKQKMIQRIAKAKGKEERINEVKLEYYRTISLFHGEYANNMGSELDLETYLNQTLNFEFNKQKQDALQTIAAAENELKEKKFVIVDLRLKELKQIEKILENPAKLKEKMTKDFKEALAQIDDNGDKKISAREFNEYQVKSYLKWLLIETFAWERDIAAKKRPAGSPLYKRLESEANEIVKAAVAQAKKDIETQEAAAIMSDDEEDKALQDFKTESKDPS
jgi:hypothetical protein